MLREAVAASYEARGLPTSPDQVMVVPGALAGRRDRGACPASHRVTGLVLESPTYPNAIATLTHAGARLVGVDVPPDAAVAGADVDGLVAAMRQVAPRVAYLIPDFHNPTGALMLDDEQRAGWRGRSPGHARRPSSTSRWWPWRSTGRRCRRRSRRTPPARSAWAA